VVSASTALQLADWRRQTHAMYAAVRSTTDAVAAHELWRRGRDRMFAEHPSSPLLPEDRAAFTGLPVLPYDPDWRFEAVIEPTEARRLEVETGTDGTVPFELVGRVVLAAIGTLDVWRLASYGGGLFLPVKDALAGRAGGTYGGGRYLLDTVKGADLGPGSAPDTLVLDFNFAYNPSCAYDPAWACPLAGPGNSLAVEIPVGERYRR